MATIAKLNRLPHFSLLSDDDLLESFRLVRTVLPSGWLDVTVEELERANLQRTVLLVQQWEDVSKFLKHCTTFPAGLCLDCKTPSLGEVERIIETLSEVVAQNSAAAAVFHLLVLLNLSTSESGAVVAKYLLHPATQTHLRHLYLEHCSREAWAHVETTLQNPQCPLTTLHLECEGRHAGGFGIVDVQQMPNLTTFNTPYYGDQSSGFQLGNLGRLSKLFLEFYNCQQLPAPLLDALESPQCPFHTLYLIGPIGLSISSRLAQALQSPHNSVRELGLFIFPKLSLSEVVVHLHKALQISPPCKIQALHLWPSESRSTFGEEETELIAEMLQSHLLGMELINVEFSGATMDRFSQALQKSKLHTLMLRRCSMTDEAVSFLANALRGNENPNFTFLDLLATRFPSREAKMSLIEALETNFHLTKLIVDWEDNELEARCAMLLERNEQMQKGALLQQRFRPPNTGRLFICGNQEVGKTTLRRGLSKACSNIISPRLLPPSSSMLPQLFRRPREARARGIDLETLQFQGGKQLVVHDLSGQREYHSFHQFFVTGTTQDLFILVSKFDPDQTKLEAQMKYWLKFICSHCSSPASSSNHHLKPRVMLVLNFFAPHHRRNDTEYMRCNANDRTQTIKAEFEAVLNFEPEIFGVDARIISHLVPIARRIEYVLDQLFASRQIPQLCNEIASLLADTPPQTRGRPFQNRRNKSIFRGYSEVVEEHRKMFPMHNPTSNEAFEAAMKELHQEGKIVYFHMEGEEPKNQIIIANCGLFYHVLMGTLFEPENLRTNVECSNSRRAWVWRVEDVKDILRKQEQCEEEQLNKVIQYLEKLEFLYFTNRKNNEVLVPSLLSPKEACKWPNTSSSPNDLVHFGRRFCCEDKKKTLLPSVVFSRLQVKLHAIVGIRNPSFQVGDGWILFSENKVNVFVFHGGPKDQWEERQWIDIMVRHDREDEKEAVAEGIVKMIVRELFEILAGNRALEGVELEEKVMRDQVVKDLNTKSNHVQLLSEIKDQVLKMGYNCNFIWSDQGTTPILQLLWSSEVKKLLQQHAGKLRSLEMESNAIVEEASKEEEPLSIGSTIFTLGELCTALENLIAAKFQWLDKRNEERHRKIMESLEKARGHILSRYSNQSVLRDLLEEPLPSLTYLSDEIGHFQELNHFLLPGANFGPLQIMCESSEHDHPHPIEEQEGDSITIRPLE